MNNSNQCQRHCYSFANIICKKNYLYGSSVVHPTHTHATVITVNDYQF